MRKNSKMMGTGSKRAGNGRGRNSGGKWLEKGINGGGKNAGDKLVK